MQVSMNTNSQNPNFGYFNKPFNKEVTKYLTDTITKEADRIKFDRIIKAEESNSGVNITLQYTNERLYAYLRSYNDDRSIRLSKDIEQGTLSRIFGKPLSFFTKVHNTSTELLKKDSIAAKVMATAEQTKQTDAAVK